MTSTRHSHLNDPSSQPPWLDTMEPAARAVADFLDAVTLETGWGLANAWGELRRGHLEEARAIGERVQRDIAADRRRTS